MNTTDTNQPIFRRVKQRLETNIQSNAEFVLSMMALLRVAFVFILILFFILLGGSMFESNAVINSYGRAEVVVATNPFFTWVPVWLVSFVIYVIDPRTIRYAIAPILAIVIILMSGGKFVADIYAIDWRSGLKYVISSMFGVPYPKVNIDGGEMKLPPKVKVNILDIIGGPGYAAIQPGNAVMFRWLRRRANVVLTSNYFMSPFERIGLIMNLDEQHGYADEITCLTQDGIPVKLRQVNFRYRILPEIRDGKPVRRSLKDPFPVSLDAIEAMATNLLDTDRGPDSWRTAVQRATIGMMTDYINAHTLDFLTAPREGGLDPRKRIQEELFSENSKRVLRGLGAELLFIDLGHFETTDEIVNRKRVELWAANLRGEANSERAEGEARLQAYKELGRAEAEAELIKSIANAMEGIQPEQKDRSTLRKILLMRAAQVLGAIGRPSDKKEGE